MNYAQKFDAPPAPRIHQLSYTPYTDSTANFHIEGARPWQHIAQMLQCVLPELTTMEENLSIFKDIFTHHVRAIMRALGIPPTTRVVIGLNEEGELKVIHMRHEKAADLEAILTKDDEARSQLAAIALRTKMLTQIESLSDTLTAMMQDTPMAKNYHMSLIGDLSHFYSA